MDWARATLAGGLAAAANVGQVAPGQGWLAGAAKGAQGMQQQQRQQALDAQAKQQQQFENAEKQKQDVRQEAQLQNELQNSTAQRALTTAQTASSIQTAQQNAARFPTLQKEDQARYQQLSDQIHKSQADTLSVLSAAGVDVSKLDHITSSDQLTDSHAQQAGSGSVFAVPNGEAHSDGEDKAGAYVVPGDVWDKKLEKPVTITTGWDIDPKTGKATPKTTTAQPGTSVGTLVAIAQGAQQDLAKKQQAIIDQSTAEKAAVSGAGAAKDEHLKQGLTQSEIDKNEAEAKAAGTKNEAKGDQPVYAYNTQTKQQEQTTKNEMASKPGVYTNPVDIKEGDIRKDVELVRQLGDAQLNLSRYKGASDRFDASGMSESDRSRMASLMAEDKLKVGLFGTELPTDWAQKLYNSEQWNHLSPAAQDAMVSYLGARGAVIAYQKAVSGSGRANKEQLELELQNIPSPLEARGVRDKKFERFQSNIDQTGAGLPKMVGIERPQEIRQRLEAEEAKNQGATHVYNPDSGNAEPVKNIFGTVIGHKGPNGELVRNQ